MDKKNNFKRIPAIVVLILIAIDIICLFVNVFTGGDQGLTLVFLFFLVVVPAVAYIFMFFYNTTTGSRK